MEINLDKVYEFLIRETEATTTTTSTTPLSGNGKQTNAIQTKNEEN